MFFDESHWSFSVKSETKSRPQSIKHCKLDVLKTYFSYFHSKDGGIDVWIKSPRQEGNCPGYVHVHFLCKLSKILPIVI